MSQDGMAEITRAGENLRHDVVELLGAVRRQREYVTERVRERPALALGAAFTAGFILGGGLATRVGSRLLLLGMRLATAEMARRLVSGGEMGEVEAEDGWAP